MKENSLKIVVVLNEAFPELRFDILKLPVKLRPDRLRALASLGLQVQFGRLNQNQQVPVVIFQEEGAQVGVNQGDLKALRFAVILNEAVPDLYSTFLETPARLRAERMRLLASLGLHICSGGTEIIPSGRKETKALSIEAAHEAQTVQPAEAFKPEILPEVHAAIPPPAIPEILPEANADVSSSLANTNAQLPTAPAEQSAKVNQEIPIKAGKKLAWLAKSLGG